MTVLLPWPASELPAVPDQLDIAVWDGTADPVDAEAARFVVHPYTFDSAPLEALKRMTALEVVQTQTAGVDHITPYLPSGVTLCNARGVHDASTAELAVGLVLASQRDLPGLVRAQDAGRWKQYKRPSLADRTVMILGYGSIGEAVERRLQGFEVDIVRVASRAREGVSAVDELPRLLPHVDIVIVVVPLTDATRGLVNAKFLSLLKDDALLVNVARGPVVDTDALLVELNAGRLRAALDVTDPEPLPADHALWHAPGALVLPHVGGMSSAMRPRIRSLVSDQLARFAAGEPLENVVIWGGR